MRIEIYIKHNCPQCEHAKKLLDNYNIPHTTYVIGKDVDRLSVVKVYPGNRTAPIIVVNGQPFATYNQFVMWIAHTDFSNVRP